MKHSAARIGVGSRFTYDGEVIEVVEVHTVGASLEVVAKELRTRRMRRVALDELLYTDRARQVAEEDEGEIGDNRDVAAVVLASLTDAHRKMVSEKAGHVREVLTGYRSGSEEVALPGEPRADYAPETSLGHRCAAKAAELGKGIRTIERWINLYRSEGEAGLVSSRAVRPGSGKRVDPTWTQTVTEIMVERTDMSRPNGALLIDHARARVIARYGEGVVRLPSRATAYRVLELLERQNPILKGSTKRNRDIASRSEQVYGKLRPTRPGEYMVMDTTRLDVFAMDPLTLRWVGADLTVAMDWYTRCITGARLTPVSTKSIDAATVLYQAFRPLPAGPDWPASAVWPPHGVPQSVLIDKDVIEREGDAAATPAIVPETVIVDHGKIFVGSHLTSVCQRLGISIQPARLREATDKGPVERFFLTLRESLLQELPGYKGPDVYSRGIEPERDAFFYLDELEAIIRKWIAVVYHQRPHGSLLDPSLPSLSLTPAEMFEHGIARAGYIETPSDPDLAYEFLRVEWRTIQHYGVEVDRRRYNGPGLAPYRNTDSPYTGKNGHWPIHVNPDDITRVYFRDPATRRWHALLWEHAPSLEMPMSEDAVLFARRLAKTKYRHFDDRLALAEMLERRQLGQGSTMTERRIALRLSREQSQLAADLAAESSADRQYSVAMASVTFGSDQSRSEIGAEPSDGFGDLNTGLDIELDGESLEDI
jgi:transposase InsO family protein